MDLILEDMEVNYHNEHEFDAILVSGDFVVHGVSRKDLADESAWPEIKDIIRSTIQMIAKRFPKVPIIPALGNNDCINHY